MSITDTAHTWLSRLMEAKHAEVTRFRGRDASPRRGFSGHSAVR